MSLGKWVGLIAVVTALYILWRIHEIVLLVFAAVVFATAINRIVRLLQRFGINRGGAIALSISSLLLLVIGLFVTVIPPFVDQLQQLTELIPQGVNRLQTWVDWLQSLLPKQFSQDVQNVQGIIQQVQAIAPRLINNFYKLFSNSLAVLLKSLLVLVLIIMLLANPAPYRQGFILLFPAFYRRRVQKILRKCEIGLGGWVAGILFNMTVITVLSLIGLWILQVPLPLANALLAGLLTFIPNLGPTLSVIPPIALSLLDSPWKALSVLILYIIIQQLESNVLTPLVMQRQVALLPAVTLVSQLIFASFFGFLGLFLALPILVIVQVWIKEVLVKDILNNWQRPELADHRKLISTENKLYS